MTERLYLETLQEPSYGCVCTHTHTYTVTDTYTCTNTHACTHAGTPEHSAHTHMHGHIHTHMYTPAHIQTYKHMIDPKVLENEEQPKSQNSISKNLRTGYEVLKSK